MFLKSATLGEQYFRWLQNLDTTTCLKVTKNLKKSDCQSSETILPVMPDMALVTDINGEWRAGTTDQTVW